MKEAINTVEAKNRLNELISEVEESHIPIIIERRGEPVAVLIDYQSYTRKGKKRTKAMSDSLIQDLNSLHTELRKRHSKGTGTSTKLLHEVREERGGV